MDHYQLPFGWHLEGFIKYAKHKDGPVVTMLARDGRHEVYWTSRLAFAARRLDRRLHPDRAAAEADFAARLSRPAPSHVRLRGWCRVNADFQRSRVYRWERECELTFDDDEAMTLAECVAFVREVWEAEGRQGPPPKVKDGRGRRRAASFGGAIALPRWARHAGVVLHELAHEMCPGDKHGPVFVRTYIDLAVRHMGEDADLLEAAAKEARVAFVPRPRTDG